MTTLLTPAQWAQQAFAFVQLGDQRLTQRLVRIGAGLARNPGGTLPQAFPDMKDLKAAYRFFSQPKVGPPQIQRPHWEQTRKRCREPGEYLLIEDTSELDYSDHGGCRDLGPIGNGRGRGLLLHSTLAVRVEAWDLAHRPEGIVLGLLGQQCWRRRGPPKRGRETWKERIQRPRESQRWGAVLEQIEAPPAHSQWIFLADREADFYEPIEHCRRRGVDFIIRSYRDRRVAQPAGYLKETLALLPVRGQMAVELRSRPGQEARIARVQVRSGTVYFRGPERPDGNRPDFTTNVVEVKETDAPPGVEPLHWVLLTSLPCQRWTEVQRIVGRYTARWWIEEYHKALKSGVGAEESQLQEAYRIETLVAVLAIVAVRLLNAKWLARSRGDEPVNADVFGPEALKVLAARFGQPPDGWTHRSVLVAVARLGGFLARKGDGLPGWQTIWRGWQRLMWMCEGLETLQHT
jgi:Transposase DNA-binding/Transposase Tn5 dimerisation domain